MAFHQHLAATARLVIETDMTAAPDTGNRRETSFLSQLRQVADVTMPADGDFLVNGRYLFEVGGAGKTCAQIRDIPDSFLAIDDTETGHAARIPLYLFGLLY